MELSDLTPELFEKAEFTERRRGYDIDQVERFLEETGTALAQLLVRYRQLEERAIHAESRATELERTATAAAPKSVESRPSTPAAPVAAAEPAPIVDEVDEEIERATSTLVMARRTADATVADARSKAQGMLTDAQQRAEAEYATSKNRAIQEVSELQTQRDGLTETVSGIEAHLEQYRTELNGVAASLVSLVSDSSGLGPREPLSVSDGLPTQAVDAVAPAEVQSPEPIAETIPAEPESSATDIEGEPEEFEAALDLTDKPGGPVASPGPGEPALVDPGSDKYLRELEDAVNEKPNSDDAMSAFFEQEEEPGRRFGWRR